MQLEIAVGTGGWGCDKAGWATITRVGQRGDARETVSARKSPWQNPFVERVIGSIRRECTDHIIPLNERHLLRVLGEYVDYYNSSRPHLSLDGNAPEPREVERLGMVTTSPVLGGLHHRYRRSG